MSLRRAVLLVVALVVVLSLLPVGVLVLRQVEESLDARMREDLLAAPRILDDRWSAVSDVRMMHARDLATATGLPDAVVGADTAMAERILLRGATGLPERPVLVDSAGGVVFGEASPPPEIVERTREGEMPVEVVGREGRLHLLALAPVSDAGVWVGAAGGSTPLDDEEARTLAGLTRTDVVMMGPDGVVSGTSLASGSGDLAVGLLSLMQLDTVARLEGAGAQWYATSGALPGGAKVFFLRDEASAFDLVRPIRSSIFGTTAIALLLALALGAAAAALVSRPVAALADAAEDLRGGGVDTPLPRSGLTEVQRLTAAFGEMRERLAGRLRDLESANEELAEGQRRLASMQAELVQRERRLAAGRMVSQLAHEIRNPIASIRNCLEVILRDVAGDPEAEDVTRTAIDELHRMHELTEQMLSMNRPGTEGDPEAVPLAVAADVGRLVSIGVDAPLEVSGDEATVAVPKDGLKQVLLNLVLNAREASGGGPVFVDVRGGVDRVVVSVTDEGPGIDEALLARIFDPFFTTKAEVQGVGLGLFVAEAIVRRHGGSIRAENRTDRSGARFVLDLPRA